MAEEGRFALHELADFVRRHPRLFVLTGAGCSTASGIPDYRDAAGEWKRRQPVRHQEFMSSEAVRKRYWARSMLGWRVMGHAAPNASHQALAALEDAGHVNRLVTQNVDGLHQQAGSRAVIELHGGIAHVVCMSCGQRGSRRDLQGELERLNPWLLDAAAATAPDGDADIETDFSPVAVPACPACGGVLKPDVVFFGDSVPRPVVTAAMEALEEADGVLVVGSSLMVYSGYRFCVRAGELGKPVAAVNLGRTRADPSLALKVEAPCGEALDDLVGLLGLQQF